MTSSCSSGSSSSLASSPSIWSSTAFAVSSSTARAAAAADFAASATRLSWQQMAENESGLKNSECFGLNVASWFHQFYGRALRAPLPKQSDPAYFCPSRPLTCKFPQQVVVLNVKEASKLIMIRLTDNLKPEQPADKNVVCLLNWVQIRYFHDLLGRHVWVRLHLIT